MNKIILVSSVLGLSLLASSSFAAQKPYVVHLCATGSDSTSIVTPDGGAPITVNNCSSIMSMTQGLRFTAILNGGSYTVKCTIQTINPKTGADIPSNAIVLDFNSGGQLAENYDGTNNGTIPFVTNTGDTGPRAVSPYCSVPPKN